MKKILFATTALVATASVAAADISFGGFAYAGITDNGTTVDAEQSVRLWLNASVETDGGVTFSAYQRVVNPNTYGYVKVASGGASLTAGSTHGAIRKLARVAGFHGYNNGGIGYFDNAPSSVTHNDGGQNLYAAYSVGGLTLGLSADAAETGRETEYGVSYTMNNITVGAAASSNDFWAAKVAGTVGGVSIALGVNELETTSLTASASMGAASTVSFGLMDTTAGSTYGVELSHDLGGASLIANAQTDAADVTTAGLGVMFNF